MRGNYGHSCFNVWDRLMGANHPDYETRYREVTSRPPLSVSAPLPPRCSRNPSPPTVAV